MAISAFITDDIVLIQAAYRALMPEEHRLRLVTWRSRNPGGGLMAAIANQGERTVGLSTYVSAEMQFGPNRGRSYQAVDSIVDPEWRGRGIFARLAEIFSLECAKQNVPLIWGFPNENAAPIWFGKLGWTRLGSPPFLVKPLRAGYVLRKLGLGSDFPLTRLKNEGAMTVSDIGLWADRLWELHAADRACSVSRTSEYLQWRLARPECGYRLAAFSESNPASYVISRTLDKWGGKIAYIFEAIGGNDLPDLLRSELGHLASHGAEVAVAWCYPHSANYSAYKKAGFLQLPDRFRPVTMHVGCRVYDKCAHPCLERQNWYHSYLDADTM